MRQRSSLHPIFGGLSLLLLLVVPTLASERGVKRVEASDAVERHALVIGNSAYTQTSPLRNPVNDATSMTRSLQSLGFRVTTLTDSGQRAMDQAIRKFGKTLRNQGGVGLFYYAGHGMQVDGENFLLPVDIDPSTEADVRYDAVPVGKLLGQLEAAGNGMNIVILDACRNNPFARSFRSASKGLAQVSAPSGTFISYATGPGKVAADGEGENGLFTEKLVAHLATPGLKLEEVFKRVRVDVQRESMGKQVPWDSSSVTGDFYFAGASQQTAVAVPATPVQQAQTAPPQSPAATAASASPAAEKLWKRHQLAKQRGLASIQQKTADALIRQHPNSDYAIRIQSEQLQSRLDRDGLTPALSADLEALRARHPRHPAVAGLTASALPRLMARAADHRQAGQLDRAVADYQLAERWGAAHATLRRHLLAVRGERVRQLIDSGNFEKAEEALLDMELTAQDATTVPNLYAYLNRGKQQSMNFKKILKWVRKLIIEQHFELAQKELMRWKHYRKGGEELQELHALLKQNKPQAEQWTEKHTGMKFRKIPHGSFIMGSPSTEEGRGNNETAHTVAVGEFWMSETEVTVGQFRQFVIESGYEPESEQKGCWWWVDQDWETLENNNWKSPGFLQDERHPVVCVSWNDTVAYAEWLSHKTGKHFRLPTEAEWEYAARAGATKSSYWEGDLDQVCNYASVLDPQSKHEFGFNWKSYSCDDGHKATAPVGSFRVNAFGLHDMLGNVWEWTCSEYKKSYDGSEKLCSDKNGARRSLRSGSWGLHRQDVRFALRMGHTPDARDADLGFRLVLE